MLHHPPCTPATSLSDRSRAFYAAFFQSSQQQHHHHQQRSDVAAGTSALSRAAGPCKRACKSLQGRSSQGRRGQTRGSLQQRAEQQHGRLGLYSIHLTTFRQPSVSICYPLGWANLLTPGTAWLADCCTGGRGECCLRQVASRCPHE